MQMRRISAVLLHGFPSANYIFCEKKSKLTDDYDIVTHIYPRRDLPEIESSLPISNSIFTLGFFPKFRKIQRYLFLVITDNMFVEEIHYSLFRIVGFLVHHLIRQDSLTTVTLQGTNRNM